MRRRTALWTVIAVWLGAAGALGQAPQGAGQPATGTSPATSSASAPAGSTAAPGTTTTAPVTTTTTTPAATTAATTPPAGDAVAPSTAAEGTTTTSAGKTEVDAATYAVRLRDLEQRINELKEQIFRSKARLSLLAETVLQGVVAGSQTTIVHENKMSGSYKLVKVAYSLDGAPIFNRADEEGGLSERPEFDVYNGAIVPGEHTLTVNLEYRGHGFGIFSYLKGYRFKVRSSYSFSAPEGKAVQLRAVAYEKGGPTAPLEERPAVRYLERVVETGSNSKEEPSAQPAATAPSGSVQGAATTTDTGGSLSVGAKGGN